MPQQSHPATPPDVGAAMLRAVVDRVTATHDAAVRGEPDGVHRHRTEVRQARGVLAALRLVLQPAAVDAVRIELAAWGTDLGVVRDAEVRPSSAAGALEAAGIEDPDVRRRLVDEPRGELPRLQSRLVAVAGLPRHRALLDQLTALAAAPPDPGADPPRRLVRRLVRREIRRVRRRRADVDAPLAQLHEFRKAARRLRHVAEAVHDAAPGLWPKRLRRLANAGKRIHGLLGDHRDGVLLADEIRRARSLARHRHEPVEPYDLLLDAVEREAAHRLAALTGARRRFETAAARFR